jgi:AdoMet-dependent heme synthase
MARSGRTWVDFDEAPFLIEWEVTRACSLSCAHCRSEAIPRRDPQELTTGQGIQLIDQVRAFRAPAPLLILAGGDPTRRPDLDDLVHHAGESGVAVSLAVSGTASVTRRRLQRLQDAGLSRITVSLDGPTPETHDAFRRQRGSHAATIRSIDLAVELGLQLQINTLVSRTTLPFLEAMADRVSEWPLLQWSVSFLLRTGKGVSLDQVTPEQAERALNYLYDLSLASPFAVTTADAPHYQRVIWQREHPDDGLPAMDGTDAQPKPSARTTDRRRQVRWRSVNDGNGFIFIDHLGNICPSRLLPVARGDVRTTSISHVYRYDEIFMRLRNPDALLGKCGRCQFRVVCGGSRSRAFAATGALMASDPLCVYDPGSDARSLIAFENHGVTAMARS